jgi:hypothetical protein
MAITTKTNERESPSEHWNASGFFAHYSKEQKRKPK